MKVKNAFSCAAVALIAGCTAIREAREAQSSAEEKSRDDRVVWQVIPPPGEGSPGVTLSLSNSVDFAISNRPSVVSAWLDVQDARLTMKQIAADAPLVSTTPWNALHLSASGAWNEKSGDMAPSDFDWKTDGDPSASLSLEVLLYDFGRHAADARAQAERVIAAEQSLIESGYAAFEEVSSALFDCREKIALQSAAETNRQAFANRLEQVESQVKEGEAKNLDLLRAKLDLAQAEESLQAASNEVRTAFAEYRYALGIPAEYVCPEADLKCTLADDRLHFSYPDPVTLARTNAPAMRIARARLRAASAEVDRAVADLFPTVKASASLSWTDPMWAFNWGVSVAQSIFQGFKHESAIEIATVALKKAEATVDATEQKLMCDLELAIATRENAREAERSARKSLESAEENLALVSEQCRLGEADRIELTDALNSVAEARSAIAIALSSGQKAEASLFVLTGTTPVYINETKENQK